jgi:hypothetical protein
MKKVYSLLTIILLTIAGANAQTALQNHPRFGTLPNEANNGAILTYNSLIKSINVDTIKLNPSNWYTAVKVDSAAAGSTLKTLKMKIYTNSARKFDNLDLIFTSDTVVKVVTFLSGTNYKCLTAGTVSVKRHSQATISLVFDGLRWVEKSRFVQ